MPAAQAAFLPELEQALAGVPVAKYVETVRRIADFFLADASRFTDEQVHLFDRLLGRMIVAMNGQPLVELSRRLAPLRNAPPDVMRRLAADPDITVAAPVLARSARLNDLDLAAVATTGSQAHRLAISGRATLSEPVTDVLVECGDRDVARNVALNQAARLSDTGMATLGKRAARDVVLAEKLVQRRDVPRDLVHHLVVNAPEDVRERLLAAMRPEHRSAVEQPAGGACRLAEGVEDSDAWRKVRAMKLAGRLGEAEVLQFAEAGRRHETAAALALICDMSVDVARRLIGGDQPEAALILCQAAGISWPAAQAIVAASRGRALDADAAVLDRLSPSTAQQIVGFWRAAS